MGADVQEIVNMLLAEIEQTTMQSVFEGPYGKKRSTDYWYGNYAAVVSDN